MPSQRPISIFGAGIGGLALGQCLRKKGIPAALYEKVSASSQRHSYGITLHPSSYNALSELLGLDTQSFRRQTAVDRLYHRGIGELRPEKSTLATRNQAGSFRANRASLEKLLRKGLQTKYNTSIQTFFKFGHPDDPSSLIVDALGVHSPLRLFSIPHSTPTVLPYVVFNGRRRISLAEYEKTYAQHVRAAGSTCLVFHPNTTSNPSVRLQISINEHCPSTPSKSTSATARGEVDFSYTYSRPAHTRSADTLYNPTRSNASASMIPEEFYTELASLSLPPGPFSNAFSPNLVRQDRVLHWLMRTTLPSRADLSSLASHGIVLIGDSAHATPILGGNGANAAIQDAVELAETISISGKLNASDNDPDWRGVIEAFYDRSYQRWKDEVEESERAIAEMHALQPGQEGVGERAVL
jgi:2-polyprenyl-6-methoxyphenol hydroxylase-like FAD-dependent oxidoreductase